MSLSAMDSLIFFPKALNGESRVSLATYLLDYYNCPWHEEKFLQVLIAGKH